MQCQAEKQSGGQCTRDAEPGREYCWQHPSGTGPTQVTTERMMAAVSETHGRLVLAAKQLGCAPDTIRRRMEQSDELRRIVEVERGKVDDIAELKLMEAIRNGEAWAIRFRLERGPSDSYAEQQEVSVDADVEQSVEHELDSELIAEAERILEEGDDRSRDDS